MSISETLRIYTQIYEDFEVLIDNGHGVPVNGGGKHSPDMSLYEPVYCREITARLQKALAEVGIASRLIVPETEDISLKERCRRVNELVKANPKKKYILISVHNNAAPPNDGQWHAARGWSSWIYTGASSKSKVLASNLTDAARELGLKIRQPEPGQKYWTANFYIVKNTNCPAVLTENLFQDNHEDVDFLLSEEGKETIVNLHLIGILRYIQHPYVVANS